MIKLILCGQRYAAREYRPRYDYVVISVIRYRLPRKKSPVMIKTNVIRQLLVFPEPVYRRHFVQQRIKTRYIVTARVWFSVVYTPLILLEGITSPDWEIQIWIRLEKNPKFFRWRIKQINYYFYVWLRLHLKNIIQKRPVLNRSFFSHDMIITLRQAPS